MKQKIYTEFISRYKNNAKAENTALSDDEMTKAQGGLGGANEATCPKCGKPMSRPQDKDPNGPHSDVWHCDACDVDQICSDADYIEILKV